MYFQFACPKCDKNLKVREENVGRKVRCPYCQHHTEVKAPAPVDPWDEEEEDEDEFEDDDDSGEMFDFDTEPQERSPKRKSGKASKKKSKQKSTKKPAPAPQTSAHQQKTDPTEVSTGLCALIGLAGLVLFYGIVGSLFWKHGKGWYIVDLFCDRGWVPIALVFLAMWSFAILYLKSRKLTRQKNSMFFDLLPDDISKEINPATALQFEKNIAELPVQSGESFLVNRVQRGLEHFRILRNSSEVSDRLSSQSDIDANAVESSYAILRVFIWAIPILGFIGTVLGIGDAVGSISGALEGAGDIAELKDSLGKVLGGLGTAFDTTLVALVFSILVMFPMSALKKSEEDLLNWVDEYCNENLLKRLKDGNRELANVSEGERKIMLAAIDSAMGNHHAELKTWTQKLEAVGETLTNQMTTGWKQIDGELQIKHTNNIKQLEKATIAIAEKQQGLVKKMHTTQDEQTANLSEIIGAIKSQTESLNQLAGSASATTETQQESMGQVVEQFEQAMNSLADKSESVHTEAAVAMQESSESLSACFGGLQQGLESLNSVLEQLGEKQVVIENHVEPVVEKRSWGLFGGRRNGAK